MSPRRDATAAVAAADREGVTCVCAVAVGPDGETASGVGGVLAAWSDPQTADSHPTPASVTTLFDLASLTKLYTAVTALVLAQAGELALDEPIERHLPESRWPRGVTPRTLLTHTSGLPGVLRFAEGISRAECERALLAVPVAGVPGTAHRYSCVGYLALGLAIERLAGASLPRVIRAAVLDPLGLADTTYAPDPARCAATEWKEGRGMVRGEVHDHAAWVWGGAGNAGLFATGDDVARLGRVLVDGGGLLDAVHHRLLVTDQAGGAASYGQGMGPRLDDASFMPPEAGWVGHTGFTGTSLLAHPRSGRIRVLLTNAVHPLRGRVALGGLRSSFG